MQSINTILVATDFSGAADSAVAYACDLAVTRGATLHVLHVIENPFPVVAQANMYWVPPPHYLEDLDEQLRRRLTSLLTDEQRRQTRAVFETRLGSAAEEILEYIRIHGQIDLVVMGSSGSGAMSRLLLGSVAETIVRLAPCPVLTVHGPARLRASEAA